MINVDNARRDNARLLQDCVQTLRMWRISWFLGRQDVKARFRRSHIGPLWILLNLSIWVGGVGLVYGLMFGQEASAFLPQLMAGFVVWGFVSATLVDSTQIYVNAQGYIKQFAFPKQIHICRGFFASLIVFGVGVLALLVVLLILGRLQLVSCLLALPGLGLLLLIGLGHSAIFAYAGVRYRDLPHAMSGALQVAFLVTPIVFPASLLRDKGFAWVYELNPFHYMIDIVRYPLLTGEWAVSASYVGAMIYLLIVWGVAILVGRQMDRQVVFLL